MKERVLKVRVIKRTGGAPLTKSNVQILQDGDPVKVGDQVYDARVIVQVPEKKVTITESEFESIMNNDEGIISVGVMNYLQEQFGFNE